MIFEREVRMDKLLTLRDVAKTLRKGQKFVRAEIKAGRLRAIDLRADGATLPSYRIFERDLEKWLTTRQLPAQAALEADADDGLPLDDD